MKLALANRSRLNHTIFFGCLLVCCFCCTLPKNMFLASSSKAPGTKDGMPNILNPWNNSAFRTIGCWTALLHMAQSDSTHWRSPRICLGSPIDKYNYVYILCMYKHVYIYIYIHTHSHKHIHTYVHRTQMAPGFGWLNLNLCVKPRKYGSCGFHLYYSNTY